MGFLDLFQLLADLGYLSLVADYDVASESRPYCQPRRSKQPPVTA